MSLTNDLALMLGADAVLDSPDVIRTFSRDQSFELPGRPYVVAYAGTAEQVQTVVRYANRTRTPVVPVSSGLNLHGACIPKAGGIVLNLSRMRALEIDQDNWFAVVEPGVTMAALQDSLAEKGLRAMLPLGAPPGRSALSSVLERDPALASASFEYGNDLLMDTEIVLPTGDLFRTGIWSAGGRPGSHMGPVRSMIYRFWTAAQGTLGILTRACIKVERLPDIQDLRAFAFKKISDLIVPLRDMQRREIGLECFALNGFNLAALLSRDWQVPDEFPAAPQDSPDFDGLRASLPPWTLFICIAGGSELAGEKVAYESEALGEIATKHGLAEFNIAEYRPKLLQEVIRPWGILKKFRYRGSVHDVSFKAPLARVPEFQQILQDAAAAHDYPAGDIGAYVLPIERGRTVHCEFDLHCDYGDAVERERTRKLWLEASRKLVAAGAFFDRPYGAWAPMMYDRSGTYAEKLRQLKKELDPNNIMNPGRLCFEAGC